MVAFKPLMICNRIFLFYLFYSCKITHVSVALATNRWPSGGYTTSDWWYFRRSKVDYWKFANSIVFGKRCLAFQPTCLILRISTKSPILSPYTITLYRPLSCTRALSEILYSSTVTPLWFQFIRKLTFQPREFTHAFIENIYQTNHFCIGLTVL